MSFIPIEALQFWASYHLDSNVIFLSHGFLTSSPPLFFPTILISPFPNPKLCEFYKVFCGLVGPIFTNAKK